MFKWFSDVKAAAVRLANSLNGLADQVDEARELLASTKEQAKPVQQLEDRAEEHDELAPVENSNGRKRIKKPV